MRTLRSFYKNIRGQKQHFDKVSELVEGFESPFGMELLATVHWVVTKENATSKGAVGVKVHQWEYT